MSDSTDKKWRERWERKKEQKKQISSLSSVRPPISNGGIYGFLTVFLTVSVEPNELNTTHPAPPLSPHTETGWEELTVEIEGIQDRI